MELGKGLSTEEVKKQLAKFGPNEIKVRKPSFLLNLLHWLISPITLMLLAAAGLSLYSQRIFDFYFILVLTGLNFVISAFEQRKADQAVAELQNQLLVESKVLRNGSWISLDSKKLVPGDIIALAIGDILPADVKILSADNFSANQAALTGESLPKEIESGGQAYAGSFVATGSAYAEISKTGKETAFGKTLVSVEKSSKRSLLEKDILSVAYLLSAFSLLAVVFISLTLFAQKLPTGEILRLDLSLLIAGVPISMPTIMTIIIGLGILVLSRKKAVVRQMSALENLANVNLLLTDKTGTLTKNLISVEKIIPFGKFSADQVLRLAAVTINLDFNKNAIDQAVIRKAKALNLTLGDKVLKSVPADSGRKRSTTWLSGKSGKYLVSFGAVQIVAKFCRLSASESAKLKKTAALAADKGFRALAVATKSDTKEEKGLSLAGILLLSDTPQPDAAETIAFLRREGITVKMVTGDSLPISRRIAERLGLSGQIFARRDLEKDFNQTLGKSWWNDRAGFAEILPEDKLKLTEEAKRHFVVGVTGDGVNDLPAIAAADVGIAVKSAVDALRQTADIVILSEGISVIKNALMEARKIFERLYSYSVYRISESFRLIITIAFLGFAIHTYPLTPIQIILIAFLNDLPIITLAYNHVKTAHRPDKSTSRRRLYRGLLHGTVGILNSLTLYFLLTAYFHFPLATVQTAFFLKLMVSGHMLIYVAHTDERWYRFLPSSLVILATTITQLIASLFAGLGLFMTPISIGMIVFVWIWSFGWMQVSDTAKALIPQK